MSRMLSMFISFFEFILLFCLPLFYYHKGCIVGKFQSSYDDAMSPGGASMNPDGIYIYDEIFDASAPSREHRQAVKWGAVPCIDSEEVLYADIDLQVASRTRASKPYVSLRRTELYE